MDEGRPAHRVDRHAGVEHLFIVGALCPADQELIALLGDDQLHVDPTSRRALDRVQHERIRDEVGRGQHRALLRREQQRAE